MNLALPLVVMLVGGALHLLTSSKWSELGRIAFFCGLLVLLLVSGAHQVHIGW